MPKTNKERLQDNNIELQNIKTGIDNLPDNPGIEALYGGKIQYKIMNTQQIVSQRYASIGYFNNYALISWYSPYSYKIVRIEEDNSVTVLLPATRSQGYGGSILTIQDGYLYYTVPTSSGYTGSLVIRRLNLITLEDEEYWNCNVGFSYFSTDVFYLSENTLRLNNADARKVEFDVINKQIVSNVAYNYTFIFNDNYGGNYTKITNFNNNKSYTSTSGNINFMSILGNKIIVNGSLYNIDYNMVLGSKIKDMSNEDNYISNSIVLSLNSDFYMMLGNYGEPTQQNNTIGYLCTFDDELNKFNVIYQLKSPRLQKGNSNSGKLVSFLSNDNEMCYILCSDEEDLTRILGYNIFGRNFYFYDSIEVQSDKIIQGYNVYNEQLNGVMGTMPNNGALNYTPTTSQQTIPAGYTSGGTVGAVTSAIDSNIQAENIKKDVTILGVTGTLEEGGSTSIVLQDGIKFGGSSFEELPDYIANADFSQVTDFDYMFSNCTYLTTIPLIDTSSAISMQGMFSDSNLDEVPLLDTLNVTNMSVMFAGNGFLYEIPQFDTSNVTTMRRMFEFCMMLETVPVFDTSSVTDFKDMFSGCRNLSDESLDNIMQMCINATSYTGTKTLKEIGLTSEYATKCQTLSNWSSFAGAGWTTGY